MCVRFDGTTLPFNVCLMRLCVLSRVKLIYYIIYISCLVFICFMLNYTNMVFMRFYLVIYLFAGERYDFVINADQPVGAYWVQLRGLGECGIKRVQQLAILRYARGPYQPVAAAPTYDVGIPQGVVSSIQPHTID